MAERVHKEGEIAAANRKVGEQLLRAVGRSTRLMQDGVDLNMLHIREATRMLAIGDTVGAAGQVDQAERLQTAIEGQQVVSEALLRAAAEARQNSAAFNGLLEGRA